MRKIRELNRQLLGLQQMLGSLDSGVRSQKGVYPTVAAERLRQAIDAVIDGPWRAYDAAVRQPDVLRADPAYGTSSTKVMKLLIDARNWIP